MEFDSKNDQIYVEHCIRLRKVLEQYERCTKDEEKFEVSLMISILHSLAVYCAEYTDRMATKEVDPAFASQIDDCGWGLKGSIIRSTLKPEEHTLKNYIVHIRNAVSHPNIIVPESDTPATGFTTVGTSGSIKSVVFVDSPDVNDKGKIISYKCNDAQKVERRLKSIRSRGHIPDNVTLSKKEKEKEKEKYIMFSNGMPYIRMTKIKLTTDQLRLFIYNLLDILSQTNDQSCDLKPSGRQPPPAA